jgi:hypothetical protein
MYDEPRQIHKNSIRNVKKPLFLNNSYQIVRFFAKILHEFKNIPYFCGTLIKHLPGVKWDYK